MEVSRRTFLGALGTGTAAAASFQFPFAGEALALNRTVSTPKTVGSPIRLNANENAYGPTPVVKQAIRDALAEAHRYPDSAREEFEQRVAKRHGVSTEQVLIGCGSAEILKVAALAFTRPQKKLVMASPTFEMIGEAAKNLGAPVVQVPLTKDFAHDLAAMEAKIADDTGLVFICNPNNPTASITPRSDLEAFISKLPLQAHVLVDEAYHHFSTDSRDYVSFLDRPSKNERTIVLRTFSKVYGLAGMRLGYAVGSVETIERMRELAGRENANIGILRGAMVALGDEEGMRASVRRVAADRAEFVRQAQARKVSPIPSHANFAMMDVRRPVTEVIEHFKKRGILVGRPFPPLNTHLRVSFGLPEEMRAFWRAWDQLPALAG